MAETNAKAGKYRLTAAVWREVTKRNDTTGQPTEWVKHRRGDLVELDAEQATRLLKAGNVEDPKAPAADDQSEASLPPDNPTAGVPAPTGDNAGKSVQAPPDVPKATAPTAPTAPTS